MIADVHLSTVRPESPPVKQSGGNSDEAKLLDGVVRSSTGCWEWTGRVDKDGYGRTTWAGRPWGVHRLSFSLFCGTLIDGRCVCHSCDNPKCCNPVHLFIGSDADNAADRDRKGRGPRGRKNHFAKTNEDKVREVKLLLAQGVNQTETARRCGLSRNTVHFIARGKAWAHVV